MIIILYIVALFTLALFGRSSGHTLHPDSDLLTNFNAVTLIVLLFYGMIYPDIGWSLGIIHSLLVCIYWAVNQKPENLLGWILTLLFAPVPALGGPVMAGIVYSVVAGLIIAGIFTAFPTLTFDYQPTWHEDFNCFISTLQGYNCYYY